MMMTMMMMIRIHARLLFIIKIVHWVQHKKRKKLKYRKKAKLSLSTNTPDSSINLTSIK